MATGLGGGGLVVVTTSNDTEMEPHSEAAYLYTGCCFPLCWLMLSCLACGFLGSIWMATVRNRLLNCGMFI